MGILEKNGKTYLYVLNELDLTISVYCNGELCQTISLEEKLPEGACSRTVYCRGENALRICERNRRNFWIYHR